PATANRWSASTPTRSRTGERSWRGPKPQVDRLGNLRPEGQRDLLANARRIVRGVHQFEHGAAVLARRARRRVVPHAVDEVLQLVRVALVESFFERGEG